MREHKITDAEFRVFTQEAQRWIDRFGLKDWEVIFECNDDFPDNRASCCASSLEDRVCRIVLTETWPARPSRMEIAMSAFHEVMELLFMQMRYSITSIPGVDERLVDAEVHRIIRIFENAVWRPQARRQE